MDLGDLGENTEEEMGIRLMQELDVIEPLDALIILEPRYRERASSTNSVTYAEHVISSVRVQYAGIHSIRLDL